MEAARADSASRRSSISSRRSYMSMWPAPAYSFRLALSKLATSRRAKRGGVRRSLVPTATTTGTSTLPNAALSSKPSTSPTSFVDTCGSVARSIRSVAATSAGRG